MVEAISNEKTSIYKAAQTKSTVAVSFSRRSTLSIHNEAMAIAKNLKSEYQRLFEILLVVEEKQIYFEFEIPDLKTYCMELLQLSDSVSKEFCIVVRKSLEVPQLADAIREGTISIYKARRISSVIDDSNHKEWIDLAIHCTSRVVEKTVAMANPRTAAPESLKYVAGDVLDLRMGVSEEWAQLLERTKDLFSQKWRRTASAEEALFYLMSEHCRKNDPLEKAKRAERKKMKNEAAQTKESSLETLAKDVITRESSDSQSNLKSIVRAKLKSCQTNQDAAHAQTFLNANQTTSSGTNTEAIPRNGQTTSSGTNTNVISKTAQAKSDQTNTQTASANKSKSRYRPAEVEHQVDLRDECQCAHIDREGRRCQSRRWLHKHHIVEFADGGEHTVENLITLCWAHHKIRHLKSPARSFSNRVARATSDLQIDCL